jgi:hypothetical protein
MYVRWMLLGSMLAQWQCPEASSKALALLLWEMCTVLFWHIRTAIKMASKGGCFFIDVLLPVVQAAAGAIWSRYLPNGKIQWHLVQP